METQDNKTLESSGVQNELVNSAPKFSKITHLMNRARQSIQALMLSIGLSGAVASLTACDQDGYEEIQVTTCDENNFKGLYNCRDGCIPVAFFCKDRSKHDINVCTDEMPKYGHKCPDGCMALWYYCASPDCDSDEKAENLCDQPNQKGEWMCMDGTNIEADFCTGTRTPNICNDGNNPFMVCVEK